MSATWCTPAGCGGGPFGSRCEVLRCRFCAACGQPGALVGIDGHSGNSTGSVGSGQKTTVVAPAATHRWACLTHVTGSPGPYPVQLDHISFNLEDEKALEVLRTRIEAAGSEVTEVVEHAVMRSIYFTDPNGIALKHPTGSSTALAESSMQQMATAFSIQIPYRPLQS